MLFRDVVGHHAVKARLIQSVTDQRISHGQLFHGQEGSGNLPLALAYARYVLCEQRSDSDACGTCSSCLKINKYAHPDLHFVFPVATNKKVTSHPISDRFLAEWRQLLIEHPYLTLQRWGQALDLENKQLSINTEDCNEILRKLSLKTYEAEYKVMIIWLPEKINHAAIPKLLKILEEPPEKTLFILVSESLEQILATILSRVQVIRVPRLGNEEISQALESNYSADKETADRAARLADGNFAEAWKLVKHQSDEFSPLDFIDWMRMCYSVHKAESMIQLVQWVDEFGGFGRERQKQFFAMGLHTVRECLMITYDSTGVTRIPEQEMPTLMKFAPFVNGANIVQIYSELNEAYAEIERNINPKILALDVSLRLAKLLRLKPELFAEQSV